MENEAENVARRVAEAAANAIAMAIVAYNMAEYGSHVTDPLRAALESVQWSINEVAGK